MMNNKILFNTIQRTEFSTSKVKAHHQSIKLMGCHFVLTAVSSDPALAWRGIREGVAEIQRIEQLISSWKLSSETTIINEHAGLRPVQVSLELWELIDRSQRMSRLSGGAFDISGTLSRDFWDFKKKEEEWPNDQTIEQLKTLIDFRQIELDRKKRTVFLKLRGMKIGFGAIGKGYAAYRAYEVMKNVGITSGLINASGDLMCWGKPIDGNLWKINIPDPDRRKENLLQLLIPHGSVVTSGNYENFTVRDGKRYAHIIDPRTGQPVHGIKSVSVLCPNPEFGDALATAITVLGIKDGLAIVNKLNGVECLIIDENNDQHYSKNLQL